MRAGAVSASAVDARGIATPPVVPRHCSEAEYAHFLARLPVTRAYYHQQLA